MVVNALDRREDLLDVAVVEEVVKKFSELLYKLLRLRRFSRACYQDESQRKGKTLR